MANKRLLYSPTSHVRKVSSNKVFASFTPVCTRRMHTMMQLCVSTRVARGLVSLSQICHLGSQPTPWPSAMWCSRKAAGLLLPLQPPFPLSLLLSPLLLFYHFFHLLLFLLQQVAMRYRGHVVYVIHLMRERERAGWKRSARLLSTCTWPIYPVRR